MLNVKVNKMPTEIQRLSELAARIEMLRTEFEPMPDAAMDLLFQAKEVVAAHVMALEPSGMADFAAKLHMIAALNGDDDSYDATGLPSALQRCCTDLQDIVAVQF